VSCQQELACVSLNRAELRKKIMPIEIDEAEGAATNEVRAKFKPPTPVADHYRTPTQTAHRWHWHPESVRRAIRERRIASIIIGRRRLIPITEIERIEREGFVGRTA
jgi:hypothetical protein